MSPSSSYDPHYLQGIRYFNDCEFYEAHEVWEELWQDDQSPSRRFYQGLIQVAVCLHHFGNGNLRGARKLYHSARGYLEPYRPRHLGLDLDRFLAQLEQCCREILADDDPDVDIVIDAEQIPEIHLDPPPNG